MSVGAFEPQVYEIFVDLLGIRDQAPDRFDLAKYDELRTVIEKAFVSRTQAEWIEVFEGSDACVAGIIPMTEAFNHPQMKACEVFVEHEGITHPAPAPRFSRTEPTLEIGRPSRRERVCQE